MIQFIAALVMGLNAIRIGCDFPMWMQVRPGVTFVHIIPILLQIVSKKQDSPIVFLIITITSITIPQYSCIAYMVSFLVLFSDFYYKVRSYKMLKVDTVCLSKALLFKQLKGVRIV